MTDTERERIKAICEVAGVSEIDDLSDGFHTFRQLYYQRMMLFAAIVKQNRDKAWKSLRHEDGDLCFGGGWFIVGIDTPKGSYTYHYESNFYSLFECEELECGKHWDGHTEKDVTRLLSLPPAQPEHMSVNLRVEKLSKHQSDFSDLDAEPERKTGGWIPVTERLPEQGARVLTCSKDGDIWVNDYNPIAPTAWAIEPWAVIAWMPLPKTYKERLEE